MKLAFQIAKRFLASARRQTLVIILGIAVGVSVQVFIGSLITGLQKSLVDTTIGSSSQITVISDDADNVFIDDYEAILTTISTTSEQFKFITPVVNFGGIVEKETVKKEVFLRGYELTNADQIYKFSEKLVAGRLPIADYEIILGIDFQTEYAKKDVTLTIGDLIPIEVYNSFYKDFTIVGFFDFGVSTINKTWGVSNLTTLQDIIGKANSVSAIEMQLDEVFEAETLALTLNDKLPTALTTQNWMTQNADLLSGLQGQSISSYMIQVFVIISVVLGISSVLAISVMQKSKQIGILKAMGITDKDSSLVFLFQGFILGIFGAIAGVLLGLGLAYAFTTFALNADGTPVVPLFIDPGFIALSAAIALAASVLSSLFPAIKSSKLTVIEVIRNG
ncbi:MAG: FtsX-like permease family protein [Bacilli bacterium]|jgi:lipoprotein-releasing system permease protein|nr:FtsX-like permease family protein [Bacilli bacterium]MDD4057250.1 FtsX-like permease family protein [Bacilli bacterium]MDY0209675.1 FtsX-like permease family protein [Bacilli bacterium]